MVNAKTHSLCFSLFSNFFGQSMLFTQVRQKKAIEHADYLPNRWRVACGYSSYLRLGGLTQATQKGTFKADVPISANSQ